MKYVEQRFRIRGISPMLGSIVPNKKVYEEFIASKAKTDAERERAYADTENVMDCEDPQEVRVTGFYRANDGHLILKEYQIKGFLKETARCLKDQLKLVNAQSKVDNYVFVREPNITLMGADGQAIFAPDGILERPLRAMTMQGPRVAIASSEMVEDWCIEVTIRVIANERTAKSEAVTMDTVEYLLDYGEMKGLLQWRNGGYGRFTYEKVGDLIESN